MFILRKQAFFLSLCFYLFILQDKDVNLTDCQTIIVEKVLVGIALDNL